MLSASFIPVYAGLRAKNEDDEARDMAGAVFGLLSLLVGLTVGLGVLASPLLAALFTGFSGLTLELTILLMRLIFPATGALVLSAWCLGILNSHRKFFLSYAAPVVWNGCIIAALVLASDKAQEEVATWAAWGTVLGSVAQFAVQLPSVLAVLGRLRPWPSLQLPSVRQVVASFLPAVLARGVVQVSSWVDLRFASEISERAVSTLSYAQTIALLPISLFAMSISAAELPEMSADAIKSQSERIKALGERLGAGLERMAFFVMPSAVGFVLLGDLIARLLLESGKFTPADSRFTWYLLVGSGVALWAQTSGRLYSTSFYALKDTKTPLRFAALRVSLGIALGYYAVRILPGQLGLPEHLGAVFITLTTGVTAWLEMVLLRRALRRELGQLPSIARPLAKVWVVAALAGAVVLAIKAWLGAKFGVQTGVESEWGGALLAPPDLPRLSASLGLLGLFAGLYGAGCLALGVPQASALVRRLLRSGGSSRGAQ